MFYEYAVDPAIFTNPSNLQSFFESFKNRPNRLISDSPKKWVQAAFQAINQLSHEQCPPVRKKTLKENLKKLSKNSLSTNRVVDNREASKSWLEYIAVQHAIYPFAALFGVESFSTPVTVYSFSNIFLKAPQCWDQAGQKHVKRDAAIMVETMLPFLKISKQVILVDPHFSFVLPSWQRYEPILKELVAKAALFNFGKGIIKIEIHTSDRNGGVQQDLKTKVKPWLPEGIAIYCYQWPKKQMHDRFVLTDIGGLSFGHGLDENAEEGLDDVLVSVLSHQIYKEERAKLVDKPEEPTYVVGEGKIVV